MAKYDVFISYSRLDTKIADRICEAFDAAGITYFIDRQGLSAGMEFPKVLAEAIENSKLFLFLASQNSYKSKFTDSEITYAFNIKEKGNIIPYIIDGSTLPKHLQFVFSSINWRVRKHNDDDTNLVANLSKQLNKNGKTSQDQENKIPKPPIIVPPINKSTTNPTSVSSNKNKPYRNTPNKKGIYWLAGILVLYLIILVSIFAYFWTNTKSDDEYNAEQNIHFESDTINNEDIATCDVEEPKNIYKNEDPVDLPNYHTYLSNYQYSNKINKGRIDGQFTDGPKFYILFTVDNNNSIIGEYYDIDHNLTVAIAGRLNPNLLSIFFDDDSKMILNYSKDMTINGTWISPSNNTKEVTGTLKIETL